MKLFSEKIVLFSQRMDYVESHDEWRDTADQRISQWIEMLGGVPLAMPNNLQCPDDFIKRIKPEIIILTGGNTVSSSLYECNGKQEATYRRDRTEQHLLNYAMKYQIPVIGICRGFQMINVHFGGSLSSCQNHIATRHKVRLLMYETEHEVNSYHGQAVFNENLAFDLQIVASVENDLIEAIRHEQYPILGVQWHPEREDRLRELDLFLIQSLLEGRL